MIPNRYHFIWFGLDFPFTHALAIESVSRICHPDSILLHTSEDLRGQPHFDKVSQKVPELRQRPLEINGLLDGCDGFNTSAIREVYLSLLARKKWAALSDILRYLVLLREGGVYLDFDTLTVRDLKPILNSYSGFCGRERLLVSGQIYRTRRWTSYLRTIPLDLLRQICSYTAKGIGVWKHIEYLYPAAINGAILGLIPNHALAREALQAVPSRVSQLDSRRPAIGPDLLQDLVDGQHVKDVKVFDPPAFYPLGPTMAAHYFRLTNSSDFLETQVVTDSTYVLHWYNDNLRKLPRPTDAKSLSEMASRQLFARIAHRIVGEE